MLLSRQGAGLGSADLKGGVVPKPGRLHSSQVLGEASNRILILLK